LAVAATVTLLGFPLGWLWSAVAPKVDVVMTSQGVWYGTSTGYEEAAAGDGWFVFITAAAGVLSAIAVWIVARRHRGPVMLFALTVGSVASAVIAAWFGHRIGLAEYERLAHGAAVGQHFSRPANLGTKRVGLYLGTLPVVQGAVLLQAAGGVMLYTLLAGFHRSPTLGDDAPPGDVPPGDVPPGEPPPGGAVPGVAVPGEAVPVSSGWPGNPAPATGPESPAPGTAAVPPD
jgi:hypothetical protein